MRGRSKKKKSLGLKKSWSVRGFLQPVKPFETVPVIKGYTIELNGG